MAPGADDEDRARQVAGEDLLFVGHHVLAQRGARQQLGVGTGGDDRVVERDRLGASLAELDVDGVGVGERAFAVEFGDLVLLHQEVDALDSPVGNLAAAIEGGAEIEGHVSGHAERLRFFCEDVREFGIAEKRLGRDAAHVQAHTAPVLLLDDGSAQAQLCRADSSDVPTGAGSEDNDVIV